MLICGLIAFFSPFSPGFLDLILDLADHQILGSFDAFNLLTERVTETTTPSIDGVCCPHS